MGIIEVFLKKIANENHCGIIEKNASEVYFNNLNAFYEMREQTKEKRGGRWSEMGTFDLIDIFPKRYAHQYELVFEEFLPKFNKKPVLADIGCAAGDWTKKISYFCKEVDGFEYSESLINTAKEYCREISNVYFYHADARKIHFERKYDGMMLLGLLTYIEQDEDALDILRNCYDAIDDKGGIIVTKDTLNSFYDGTVYMLNVQSGYEAVYRSKEKYMELYKKAGFKLICEKNLDSVEKGRIKADSQGCIWIKG